MVNEYSAPWYSLSWFGLDSLRSFTWENPMYLYALGLVPVVFIIKLFVLSRFNQRLPVALLKTEVPFSLINYLRFLPDVLLGLTLTLLLLALARPQQTNEKVEQFTEGIDIMLALDISQSMQIQDFVPDRLAAAKEVGRNFIHGRFQDRIGLVVFSGDAFSLSPLTTDYDLLLSYLDEIDFDMIENRGTAIGSALAVVTNRMRESTAKSKVCILLSDGENTAGSIDPIKSAELASAFGIKIYTIVIGKEGMVPFGKDFFGNPKMIENNMDVTTMKTIAQIGNGEFFRATDNQALQQVFQKIDQYEKAEIKESRYKDTADYYWVYLRWGIAFFLVWLLLKSTFISNVLQD